MNHREHAQQVLNALWLASRHIATYEERVDIIATALEKQREACAIVYDLWGMGWGTVYDAILNAEVKTNKEKERKE